MGSTHRILISIDNRAAECACLLRSEGKLHLARSARRHISDVVNLARSLKLAGQRCGQVVDLAAALVDIFAGQVNLLADGGLHQIGNRVCAEAVGLEGLHRNLLGHLALLADAAHHILVAEADVDWVRFGLCVGQDGDVHRFVKAVALVDNRQVEHIGAIDDLKSLAGSNLHDDVFQINLLAGVDCGETQRKLAACRNLLLASGRKLPKQEVRGLEVCVLRLVGGVLAAACAGCGGSGCGGSGCPAGSGGITCAGSSCAGSSCAGSSCAGSGGIACAGSIALGGIVIPSRILLPLGLGNEGSVRAKHARKGVVFILLELGLVAVSGACRRAGGLVGDGGLILWFGDGQIDACLGEGEAQGCRLALDVLLGLGGSGLGGVGVLVDEVHLHLVRIAEHHIGQLDVQIDQVVFALRAGNAVGKSLAV